LGHETPYVWNLFYRHAKSKLYAALHALSNR
jgi:hypothetical protein